MPYAYRIVKVRKFDSYTADVEMMYGIDIPENLIDWPNGPKTSWPGEGGIIPVRYAHMVRAATATDKKLEQEGWDEIIEAVKIVKDLRSKGWDALIAAGPPLAVNLRVMPSTASNMISKV